MEFSPVPVTIIRVNGGPEHENAWQRTGSFYLPVPSPRTCQLSYRSPGRGPPSPHWLQGCPPPMAPLSKTALPAQTWNLFLSRYGAWKAAQPWEGAPWPSTLSRLGQYQSRESNIGLPGSGSVCWYVTMGISKS